MKGNRGRDTGPELELRRLLRQAGYPGYRLHWKNAPGRPDIAYPGCKVAIFVNGCFWHRCPTCQPAIPKSHSEYWERKFELNQERDARKNAALVETGWRVVTVWECELKADPVAVVERIVTALGGHGPARDLQT
ncbi:MAG: very short patch repair endonuclease [Actinomycetota bacterium]|nr:very short patch repair endonuclease [Actinomycetota bacterium]MDP3630834.1 very short patch repair endonuclease [Actinomycetota bacterium]